MQSSPSPGQIEDVIDSFYASAVGEISLLEAVQNLRQLLGAASAQIFTMSSKDTVSFAETIVAHNPSTHAALSQEIIEENWEGLEVGVDPRMTYSSTLPAGFVFHDHQFITDRQIDKHPFYQEFLRTFDLRYGLIANLDAPSQTQQTLLSCNNSEAQGAFSSEAAQAFKMIVPHAQRAMNMAARLIQTEELNRTLLSLIDKQETGIALLDSQGNVLEMNSTLSSYLEEADGMTMNGRSLLPSSISDQRSFTDLISQALNLVVLRTKEVKQVFVQRPSGKHPYIADAVPVGVHREVQLRHSTANAPNAVKVVLSVWDPTRSKRPNELFVQSYLRLTPKEAQIACDLCSGLTLNQTAIQRNITKQTARSHLKSIFSKTSVSSQTDLVQLVSRISG